MCCQEDEYGNFFLMYGILLYKVRKRDFQGRHEEGIGSASRENCAYFNKGLLSVAQIWQRKGERGVSGGRGWAGGGLRFPVIY